MADPNWNSGFYYDGLPPHIGLKLARRKLWYLPYIVLMPTSLSFRNRNNNLPLGSRMGHPLWSEIAGVV